MIRHLALFLLAASTPLSAAAPGRNYSVTSLDRVRVEGPYAITLRTGVAPFARAEGSPAQIDLIDLRVEGRTLVIRKRSGAVAPGTGAPLAISVGTPDLRSAILTGPGRLTIDRMKGLAVELGLRGAGVLSVTDLQADKVAGYIEGSGELRLAGKTKVATLTALGTSTIAASMLQAPEVIASAHGAAEVSAHPTSTATVSASGTARVQLSGAAACTLKVSGSAEVGGCGKVR